MERLLDYFASVSFFYLLYHIYNDRIDIYVQHGLLHQSCAAGMQLSPHNPHLSINPWMHTSWK